MCVLANHYVSQQMMRGLRAYQSVALVNLISDYFETAGKRRNFYYFKSIIVIEYVHRIEAHL